MISLRVVSTVVILCCVTSGCFAERVLVLPSFHVEFGEQLEGDVSEVSIEGVVVTADDGIGLLLPWFALDANGEGWRVPAEFEDVARASRLGYARRQRGDVAGCAELYLSIAPDLVGSRSRLGREVFDGLFEDALLRGDLFDALVAKLVLGESGGERLDGFDERYGVHIGLPLVSDVSETGLLGAVAERLSDSDRLMLGRFERIGDAGFESDPESARFESSRELSGGMSILGQELYMRMYIAQKHPSAEAREEARGWLQSRADSKAGSWVDIWCRLAIGSSYIRESKIENDDSLCSIGVIHLLHVVVRFESTHSLLARLAKSLAVEALLESGRVEEASELMGAVR